MSAWFWYALVAAILYGAHQIFTKLASDRISDGLGGFVVLTCHPERSRGASNYRERCEET
jgi:hypothetical protein